jgi:hypothetical protein
MTSQTRNIDSSDLITIAAKCFDVVIEVRCRRIDVESVSTHLPLGHELISPTKTNHLFTFAPEPSNERLFSVKRGGSRKASAPQALASALKTLQKEIYLCVAEHAKDHVFIHAGVIVWKNHAVVFPGSSHAGKSTLVWALVQEGALYYSDEYAVFDKKGYVQPFTIPISLRLDDGGRRMVMPDIVGYGRRTPHLIVFARYQPAATWRPRQVSPASAMMQLIRHSIAIRSNPGLVIPVLKHVSMQSKTFTGVRGESEQILHWMELLEGSY